MLSVPDRWLLATGIRRRIRRLISDRCGLSGARQRRSATMDPVRGETAQSRRNLRARHAGARLWGRWRTDWAFRALHAGGRRRELEERATFRVNSFEGLGDFQLNSDRLHVNSSCHFRAKDIPFVQIIAIQRTINVMRMYACD